MSPANTSRFAFERPFLIGAGLLLGLLLRAPSAAATCSPGRPGPELYVGDTASDAACTHDDLQSAIDAATCQYGTTIFVTREHTYTQQHLTIDGKNVDLIARGDGLHCGPIDPPICAPPFCPPPITSPLVTLGGRSGDAVVSISGNSTVTLRYFDINGGEQAAGGEGGGIRFIGSGSLKLDTSWVRANRASDGGGVYFEGTGSAVSMLTLAAGTEVIDNAADAIGGGILVKGNATLNALEPQTTIEFNHTDGYGGGVAVVGPAQANIGSPGVIGAAGTIGVIDDNTAEYGGGLALVSGTGDDDFAIARLFTTDSTRPVAITNNTASRTGGGIYTQPYENFFPSVRNSPYLCAWDFRIADNTAQEGAAVYADVDSGSFDEGSVIQLGNCEENGESFPSALGAVRCTDAARCNTIDDNQADDPTQGSAILMQSGGILDASRFSMRGNHVAHAIRIVGDGTATILADCLTAGNSVAHELLYASGDDTPIHIEGCTFANDRIDAAHVVHTESDLSISDTILAEPGTLALDYSGDPADLAVRYIVSNDTSTLPAGTGVVQGMPQFVDAAGGDFHLQPGSSSASTWRPYPTTSTPPTASISTAIRARSICLPSSMRTVRATSARTKRRTCSTNAAPPIRSTATDSISRERVVTMPEGRRRRRSEPAAAT